jgi:hypothetical protein
MIDWNAVTGLTGLIAAIIAILAIFVQVRLSNKLMQIDLITSLENLYNSDEFVKVRVMAANILLSWEAVDKQKSYRVLDRLLGFYEFLGLLRRVNALPDFLIWHSFSTPLFRHFWAAKEYILSRHAWNKAVYIDLLQLYDHLVEIERREAGPNSPDLNLSQEDIQEFLISESQLLNLSQPNA